LRVGQGWRRRDKIGDVRGRLESAEAERRCGSRDEGMKVSIKATISVTKFDKRRM
jgi:hypothetical protein